jgi:hypothetical protein
MQISLIIRQFHLYYTECPSEGGIAEGGIAGCGISLQYYPLLWWAGLRKVREKYHIYIYQWNCRIIKEIYQDCYHPSTDIDPRAKALWPIWVYRDDNSLDMEKGMH